MNNKQININASKAVLLNDLDNIVIAINNIEAYQKLEDFDIKLDSPILSGQKIARADIAKDSPIYKYGTIIGFADTDLLKGQVLTNSNVVFKEFGREHEYCSKYVPTRFVNSSNEISIQSKNKLKCDILFFHIDLLASIHCLVDIYHLFL